MGYRDPISAYVSAPHKAIKPPTTQLIKNTLGVIAARAESDAVLKIPIPITNPITIMVMSKRFKRGLRLLLICGRYKNYLRRKVQALQSSFPQIVENKKTTIVKFKPSSLSVWLKFSIENLIKREVRLNPGAIPVAVNTSLPCAAHFFHNTTVHTGRSRNEVKPEDLPDADFITSFREKSRRCRNCISSYSFLFTSEGL